MLLIFIIVFSIQHEDCTISSLLLNGTQEHVSNIWDFIQHLYSLLYIKTSILSYKVSRLETLSTSSGQLFYITSLTSWGFQICWLHLCRGVRPLARYKYPEDCTISSLLLNGTQEHVSNIWDFIQHLYSLLYIKTSILSYKISRLETLSTMSGQLLYITNLISWGCQICWLHLCRGVIPLDRYNYPEDNTK